MDAAEQRELTKVINSHASDIQALTAIVFGLAAQLYEGQGEAGLAVAEARSMTASKSMGSPFGVRPNTNLISQIYRSARQPS